MNSDLEALMADAHTGKTEPGVATTIALIDIAQSLRVLSGRNFGPCRVCGCTTERACVTPEGPCAWVEPDLCSACHNKLHPF